jgi:hypothetical protein
VEKLLGRCARLIINWKLLNKQEDDAGLEEEAQELERRSARAARLPWSIVPADRPEESKQSWRLTSTTQPNDDPGRTLQGNNYIVCNVVSVDVCNCELGVILDNV